MFNRNFFFFACAFTAFISVVRSDITVKDGFVPDMSKGGENDFAIYVVGDINGYSIKASTNHNDEKANATCGHYVQNSDGLGENGTKYITGQCQTNSANTDQVFEINCLNAKDPHKLSKGKGSAIITFTSSEYFDESERSTAIITSNNDIWIGYNSSSLVEQPKSLKKAPQPAAEFHGNGVGVLINCHNDKISPVKP